MRQLQAVTGLIASMNHPVRHHRGCPVEEQHWVGKVLRGTNKNPNKGTLVLWAETELSDSPTEFAFRE